jgi:hypothetical protein
MNLNLAGKSVLVTGACKGIGHPIAWRLDSPAAPRLRTYRRKAYAQVRLVWQSARSQPLLRSSAFSNVANNLAPTSSSPPLNLRPADFSVFKFVKF